MINKYTVYYDDFCEECIKQFPNMLKDEFSEIELEYLYNGVFRQLCTTCSNNIGYCSWCTKGLFKDKEIVLLKIEFPKLHNGRKYQSFHAKCHKETCQ